MQMDSEREEELSSREVPQLEARPERSADDVCYAQNREDGEV
jgi:hypothetical protein